MTIPLGWELLEKGLKADKKEKKKKKRVSALPNDLELIEYVVSGREDHPD